MGKYNIFFFIYKTTILDLCKAMLQFTKKIVNYKKKITFNLFQEIKVPTLQFYYFLWMILYPHSYKQMQITTT